MFVGINLETSCGRLTCYLDGHSLFKIDRDEKFYMSLFSYWMNESSMALLKFIGFIY